MEIDSFFCDPSELLNLSCSNTFYNNLVKYFLGAVYGLFPISGILFSYYKIVSTILRIPSSGGRYKAFSTCGSHLAVVGLFLGTAFGVHLGSAASYSPRKGAVASVMYTVVTPILNPFIYGLRNSDIKSVLRRWQKQQKCLALSHQVHTVVNNQSVPLLALQLEDSSPVGSIPALLAVDVCIRKLLAELVKLPADSIFLRMLGTESEPLLGTRCSSSILAQNVTRDSKFQLLSLSDDPDLQQVLFGLFLSMYLVTILGNLLIILAISSDSHLHTPMYFFLSNLSLADIGFISTTVPNMIVNIQIHNELISYVGCLTQMSIFIIFVCLDYMLLTVMAYDRFVAICHPLHYTVIMNPRLCGFSILVSFLLSLLDSQLHNLMILQITNFKNVEISSFFCDPSVLLNLSCTDTYSNNIGKYFLAALYGLIPISGIFFSYYKIMSSLLRIPSLGGKYKAFSTCGSHLAGVCLFLGTGTAVYLGSAVSHSPRKDAVASVMYTVVTPMLNPFIYSLRNRDIKRALRRLQRWAV
ncbi:olfactory receptor 7E178-like [Callospermophilus lateralis]|uniref:olfactory receptor 7E178-like n=1 Tax=Callospermophilus lateralis TaxID=76772 RepID=UPI0040548638